VATDETTMNEEESPVCTPLENRNNDDGTARRLCDIATTTTTIAVSLCWQLALSRSALMAVQASVPIDGWVVGFCVWLFRVCFSWLLASGFWLQASW